MIFNESPVRSLAKTVSWRILATVTTALLVLVFTGRWAVAMAIGGIEVVAKVVLYFFHERLWDHINWGRKTFTPFVLWFTGLPSSGKSTLADCVAEKLEYMGMKVERLDGDKVREIFPKTGFSREDRNMHIRRIGFLCSILEKNGVSPIASFVSPYRESREFVRGICKNFVEVYVATPLEECERRDVKGLYKKARAGEIRQFTGVDDPYEEPENPEIVIETQKESVEESAEKVIDYLKQRGFLE